MLNFEELEFSGYKNGIIKMRDFAGNNLRLVFNCREDAFDCWTDFSQLYNDCEEYMIPLCLASYEPVVWLNDEPASLDDVLEVA